MGPFLQLLLAVFGSGKNSASGQTAVALSHFFAASRFFLLVALLHLGRNISGSNEVEMAAQRSSGAVEKLPKNCEG